MKIWKVSFTIYGFVVWNFPSSPDGGRRRGLASAGCPPPWACGSRTEAALLSCVSDLNHMALPGITSWLGGRSNECPNKRLILFLPLISSVCWLSISFTVVLTKSKWHHACLIIILSFIPQMSSRWDFLPEEIKHPKWLELKAPVVSCHYLKHAIYVNCDTDLSDLAKLVTNSD